jgi:hypothetical protein
MRVPIALLSIKLSMNLADSGPLRFSSFNMPRNLALDKCVQIGPFDIGAKHPGIESTIATINESWVLSIFLIHSTASEVAGYIPPCLRKKVPIFEKNRRPSIPGPDGSGWYQTSTPDLPSSQRSLSIRGRNIQCSARTLTLFCKILRRRRLALIAAALHLFTFPEAITNRFCFAFHASFTMWLSAVETHSSTTTTGFSPDRGKTILSVFSGRAERSAAASESAMCA